MRFCTSCGAQLPEGAAFCVQCGASTSPSTDAPAPTPVTPPAGPGSVAPPVAQTAQVPPPSTPDPEGDASDRKSRKALYLSSAAIVVVAAIVVAMLFVFDVFKSDSGSSSPEAAVAQLVNSTVALSPDKALAVLAPGEVSGFDGLAKAAASPNLKKAITNLESQMKSGNSTSGPLDMFGPQFAAISTLSSSDINGALKAVSVKLDKLTYSTTTLADGIADVTVTGGELTVSADSSKIPADVKKKLSTIIGSSSDVPSWVNDLLTGNTTISHTWKLADYMDQVNASGQKLDAIVVRQNGNWYVSLYGTIAQHIYEGVAHDRQSNGGQALAQPDWKLYANPPKSITATSPEQVPANFAKAINDKSVMEIFQNLPRDEVRALYPYVPLLQTAADSGSGTSGNPSLSVTDVQATTTGTDGDLVHVIFTQGTGTSNEGGHATSASVSNGCYTVDGNKQCVSDWPDFAQTAAKVFGIDKGIPVTLRKVDGGYQLDPIGTYVGLVTSAMNHMDDLVTAYQQFMKYMEAQFAQFGASSGSSCYDASGNYTC